MTSRVGIYTGRFILFPMLRYLLVFFLAVSCRPASSSTEIPDSLHQLLLNYEEQTIMLSCTWCRVHHPSFSPVIDYVGRHPEMMPFLFSKAEDDPLFRFAFIRLLEEVQPDIYAQLLTSNQIPLRPPEPATMEANSKYYSQVYSMNWAKIKNAYEKVK